MEVFLNLIGVIFEFPSESAENPHFWGHSWAFFGIEIFGEFLARLCQNMVLPVENLKIPSMRF